MEHPQKPALQENGDAEVLPTNYPDTGSDVQTTISTQTKTTPAVLKVSDGEPTAKKLEGNFKLLQPVAPGRGYSRLHFPKAYQLNRPVGLQAKAKNPAMPKEWEVGLSKQTIHPAVVRQSRTKSNYMPVSNMTAIVLPRPTNKPICPGSTDKRPPESVYPKQEQHGVSQVQQPQIHYLTPQQSQQQKDLGYLLKAQYRNQQLQQQQPTDQPTQINQHVPHRQQPEAQSHGQSPLPTQQLLNHQPLHRVKPEPTDTNLQSLNPPEPSQQSQQNKQQEPTDQWPTHHNYVLPEYKKQQKLDKQLLQNRKKEELIQQQQRHNEKPRNQQTSQTPQIIHIPSNVKFSYPGTPVSHGQPVTSSGAFITPWTSFSHVQHATPLDVRTSTTNKAGQTFLSRPVVIQNAPLLNHNNNSKNSQAKYPSNAKSPNSKKTSKTECTCSSRLMGIEKVVVKSETSGKKGFTSIKDYKQVITCGSADQHPCCSSRCPPPAIAISKPPTTSHRDSRSTPIGISGRAIELQQAKRDPTAARIRKGPCLIASKNAKTSESHDAVTDHLDETITRVASGEAELDFPKSYELPSSFTSVTNTKYSDNAKAQSASQSSVMDDGPETSSPRNKSRKPKSKMNVSLLQPLSSLIRPNTDDITKIENMKLSSVKGHHLLSLTESEKEFLRSKGYLETSPSTHLQQGSTPTITTSVVDKMKLEQNPCMKFLNGIDHQYENFRLTSISPGKVSDTQPVSSRANVIQNANTQTSANQSQRSTDSFDDSKLFFVPLNQQSDTTQSQLNQRSPGRKANIPQSSNTSQPQANTSNADETKLPTTALNNEQTASSTASQVPNKVYYVLSSNGTPRFKPIYKKISGSPQVDNKDICLVGTSVTSMGSSSSMDVDTSQTNLAADKGKSNNANITFDKDNKCIRLGPTNIQLIQHTQTDQVLVKNSLPNLLLQTKTSSADSPVSSGPPCYDNKLTVAELLKKKRTDEPSPVKQSNPIQMYGNVLNHLSRRGKVVEPRASAARLDISKGSRCARSPTRGYPSPTGKSGRATPYQQLPKIKNKPKIKLEIPIKVINASDLVINKATSGAVNGENSGATEGNSTHASSTTHTISFDSASTSTDTEPDKRKTLPAPKPKKQISNELKKEKGVDLPSKYLKGRRNSFRKDVKLSLSKSKIRVIKHANQLDLIPKRHFVEQDTRAVITGKKKRNRLIKLKQNSSNFNKAQTSTSYDLDSQLSYHTDSVQAISTVVQIYKNDDGQCTHSIHRVNITLGPGKDNELHRWTANGNCPCVLHFACTGLIEHIDVENIKPGLYVVLDCAECKPSNQTRVVKASLSMYPPHVSAIPRNTLALAISKTYHIGDITMRNYDLFRDNCLTTTVNKVLGPLPAHLSNFDFDDKKYGSVTDSNESPCRISTMHFSQVLSSNLERDIVVSSSSNTSSSSDYTSSENLSNNSSSKTPKSASKAPKVRGFGRGKNKAVPRFSERAMALKIKQNELFESCKRFKVSKQFRNTRKRKRGTESLVKVASDSAKKCVKRVRRSASPGVKVINIAKETRKQTAFCVSVVKQRRE